MLFHCFVLAAMAWAARGGEPSSLPAAVADAVLSKYASLPKNGKPQAHEYTSLAGFALTDDLTPDAPPVVVALGTGTKCLGADRRCSEGLALADSHAEILARRALVLYMYDEIDRLVAAGRTRALENPRVSIFRPIQRSEKTIVGGAIARDRPQPWCSLRPGVRVHMYVSQSPCGDASVFRAQTSADATNGSTAKPWVNHSSMGQPWVNKRAKTAANLGAGSTGAKLLTGAPGAVTDAEFGAGAQRLGAARLKPGRGAQTSCMSCSDKMCKWNALGLQGELLSSVVESPVRISSVVVAAPEGGVEGGAEEGADKNDHAPHVAALRRAIHDRIARPYGAGYEWYTSISRFGKSVDGNLVALPPPAVASCRPPPPNLSSASGLRRGWVACGTSINWIAGGGTSGGGGTTEVTLGATGRKAGFSKKNARSPKSASRLCAASIAARFVSLAPKFAIDLRVDAGPGGDGRRLRYADLKVSDRDAWTERLSGSCSDVVERTEAYRRRRDVLIRPRDLLREGDDGTARRDSTAASSLVAASRHRLAPPGPDHPMFDTPLRDWVKKRGAPGGSMRADSPGASSFAVHGATPGAIDVRWWEPEDDGDDGNG